LIRGGTSSVGLATAVLARQRGMTVLSTTRNPGKAGAVTKAGADHVLIDDGDVARQVREILPGGADAALELVGTPTLPDTLRSVRVHGVVCFSGMLSNQWTVRDFYPLDYLPTGVRLSAYKGDAADLPPRVLQDFLDAVAVGTAAVPIGRVYQFDQIVEAHTDMEQLGYLLNRSCPAQRVALGRSDLAELNQRPGPMTFSYRSCSTYVNSPVEQNRVSGKLVVTT
jgi:NADPH:quinone reductase-like Zn-dependent oxidoreductase